MKFADVVKNKPISLTEGKISTKKLVKGFVELLVETISNMNGEELSYTDGIMLDDCQLYGGKIVVSFMKEQEDDDEEEIEIPDIILTLSLK